MSSGRKICLSLIPGNIIFFVENIKKFLTDTNVYLLQTQLFNNVLQDQTISFRKKFPYNQDIYSR